MIKYRKRSMLFPSHLTTPPKCKPMIKNPWLFPTPWARNSKKPRTRRILMVTRSSASTMIIPWILRKKWLMPVRPAQWEPIHILCLRKLRRWLWSHPLTNKRKPWTELTKSRQRRKRPNRRPNLAIIRTLPEKVFKCGTVSAQSPLNETCHLSSKVQNISKPLSRNSKMPKRQRSQQNHMRNVRLERFPSGLAPTRCRTSTNLPEFTSSTTPERGRREMPAKHRKFTRNAARPWQKKGRQWLAFSKQSAPMMTWAPTKSDQSHNSSL